MADPAVAINFPEPPRYEERRTVAGPTTGKDTKVEQLTPEQEEKLRGTQEATQRQIAATGKEREQREREATIAKQDLELQQFAAEGERNLQTGPEAQAAKAYVDWARQRTRDAESKYADMPSPRLFKDGAGWDNVRKAIGLGLAGLGDGMIAAAAIRAGHAPASGHTVADIIERDLQQQRAAIDKQKDTVLMARTGLTDAVEARRAVMADLELKAKYLYKRAELLTRQRLAALKMDQASIDQTKEINELIAKQANAEADYVKSHTQTATNRYDSAKVTTETINRVPSAGGAGGGVEAAKGSVNYNLFKAHGEWLRDNLPKLSDADQKDINAIFGSAAFFDKNTSLNAAITGVLGTDRERGMSPTAKEFVARAREAADAKGRIKSGGAINLGEEQRFIGGLISPPSDRENRDENIKMRQGLIDTDIRVMSPLDKGNTPAAPGGPTQPPPFQPTERGPSVQANPTSQYTPARVAKAKAKLEDRNTSASEKAQYREFLKEARAAGVR